MRSAGNPLGTLSQAPLREVAVQAYLSCIPTLDCTVCCVCSAGNPLGTLSQAAVREAAVRRLSAQPFESQKHVELLEGAKKELDRLVCVLCVRVFVHVYLLLNTCVYLCACVCVCTYDCCSLQFLGS